MIWLFWLFLFLYVPYHFRRPLIECWWSTLNYFRIHTPPTAWGFADFWISVWKVEQQENRYRYDYPLQYDWDWGYQLGMMLMACIGVLLAVGLLVTIIFYSI